MLGFQSCCSIATSEYIQMTTRFSTGINSVFHPVCVCVCVCVCFLPQGKLPDASQPRVLSPCPGLLGRVSRTRIPESHPNAAKDGPADPGETPPPLQRHSTRC